MQIHFVQFVYRFCFFKTDDEMNGEKNSDIYICTYVCVCACMFLPFVIDGLEWNAITKCLQNVAHILAGRQAYYMLFSISAQSIKQIENQTIPSRLIICVNGTKMTSNRLPHTQLM